MNEGYNLILFQDNCHVGWTENYPSTCSIFFWVYFHLAWFSFQDNRHVRFWLKTLPLNLFIHFLCIHARLCQSWCFWLVAFELKSREFPSPQRLLFLCSIFQQRKSTVAKRAFRIFSDIALHDKRRWILGTKESNLNSQGWCLLEQSSSCFSRLLPLMVPRPPWWLGGNEWVTGPSPPSLVVTSTSTSVPFVCPG